MSETLYLIDGYAQIFRAYYAIRGGMHSPITSEPTHAVFGFTGMLLKLFTQFHPHYVVVAVDAPGRTFRDDLYALYPVLRQHGEPAVGPVEGIGVEEFLAMAHGPDQEPEAEARPDLAPGEPGVETRYALYKGTRRPTPEDLHSQIDRVFEVIEGFGIPIIGQPGLEADDVIATITQRVLDNPAYQDVSIRIVSRDKDLEQLIGDRVTLFDIHTDTTIDAAALLANKGITPQQVIDVLALTGDTVDNVPGVEGVGLKTAAQLVQQFGSVEGVLQGLDQIKGKRRENLERAQNYLPLSKALVTLKRDADLPFSLDAARVGPIDLPALLPVFRELGFHRFQTEAQRLAAGSRGPGAEDVVHAEDGIPPGLPIDAVSRGAARSDTQTEVSSSEADSPRQASDESGPRVPGAAAETGFESEAPVGAGFETASSGRYETIRTPAQLDALVATLRAQPMIAFDTETTGLDRSARLCGLSFSWEQGQGVYVPLLSPNPGEHLDPPTVLYALKPILEDASLPKCGHNLKFDAQALLREGIRLRGVTFDSMLASILLTPSQSGHKLDHLAQRLLNYRMIPISQLIGEGQDQNSIDQAPLDQVTVYAAEDADIALRLYHALAPALDESGLGELLRRVEAPLAPILAEMEAAGILCDPEELRRQGAELGVRVEELRREVQEAAGVTFQIESTQQLAEVLFDRLGYPSSRKTKTGRSTDIGVLEKLAALEDRNDPRTRVPRLVIAYRQLTKLISTYLGNLIAAIHPEDGRIHTTYHQLVTATGRLASHNPNLQNIPVRAEVGRQIRKAFHAPPDHLLICADYSQVELRLLAHLSRDPALLDAFAQNQDIHVAVASQVFGVPLEQVTREQRAQAKTINFGIIYGITPFGLARRIEGMDVAAAMELISAYKQRFAGIDRFLQQCIHQALEQGYVATLMGRRRAIPEIYSTNRTTRNLGERLAINSVVQGSAADLIKAAMVRVQERIDRDHLPLRMLLQIHDELVLETPADGAEANSEIVCREMEQAMRLDIPLRAEAGIGPDWFSAHA